MTQDEALAILKTGANVFLTGEPGSGKTHTVNRYVEYVRSCGLEPAITASTGIAATHLGGMTIHSWSGIGVNSRITDYDVELLMQRERLVKRLREASILIIDEVSMLSADTLSSVELVTRSLRQVDQPFGGLQVVLVGDFFQLPPVDRATEGGRTPFAFRSPAWKSAGFLYCYLSEQHRQDDDVFLSVLASLRRGEPDEGVRMCLEGRCVEVMDDVAATRLYPHNANVDSLNDAELAKLDEETHLFSMTTRGRSSLVEGLVRNCLSPERLVLKVGAKVMFTKNSQEGAYANGTLGEVIDFSRTSGQPLVRIKGGRTLEVEPVDWAVEEGGKILASISQLPLRLAWAITVHKSQGMSLDAAVIDLSRAFEYGQGYVALSRVRTLEGLYLLGFNERSLEVHPDVRAADVRFRELSEEARAAFSAMDAAEIARMHADFMRTIGGTPGAGRKKKTEKVSTFALTKALVERGLSIADMARERGMTTGTIIGHLERLVADGALDIERDLSHVRPEEGRLTKMRAAFEKVASRDTAMPLSAARRIAGDDFSFDELKLGRIFVPR